MKRDVSKLVHHIFYNMSTNKWVNRKELKLK